MKRKMMSGWMSLVMIVVMGTMGSCVRPRLAPEATLRQRVTGFWQARENGSQTVVVNGRKRTLYDEFLSAADKEKLTESAFAKRSLMKVTNVRIVEIRFPESGDGTRATVTVSFDTPAKFGAWFRGVRVKQDWVLENGKWMVVMNSVKDPFRRKLL